RSTSPAEKEQAEGARGASAAHGAGAAALPRDRPARAEASRGQVAAATVGGARARNIPTRGRRRARMAAAEHARDRQRRAGPRVPALVLPALAHRGLAPCP